MEIYLLWHVRHARPDDGPATHRDDSGELIWDEQDGDDLKILGAYATKDHAKDRIERARLLPGLRDEPECFMVDRYVVNEDHWTEGFVTISDSDSA